MARSLCLLLSLLAVLFSVFTARAADDWPQWRGPNRDGRSADTGLLKKWPNDGPKLLWKATGLGEGYAGVAVVGDRLYTMGDEGDNDSLIALDRADGHKLWSTKVGRSGAPGWGGFAGPRCVPTVDESANLVFTVGQYGEVLCADATSGKAVWRKELRKGFRSPAARMGLGPACHSLMASA